MGIDLKVRHQDVIRRVSNKYKLQNDSSYNGCTIHPDWLDFDNFKSWAEGQKGHDIEGWHLDKDILEKGNKEYSSEKCCFIPLRINILFTARKSKRGLEPIGVYFDKKYSKYIARCRDGEKKVSLGSFNDSVSAFNAYKVYKENLIKKVAHEFKDQISENVFEALLRYEVEITD